MVFSYTSTRHPINQLRDEVDRLLGSFASRSATGMWPGIVRSHPAVNLWEEGDKLMVEMELPGLKSEQLDISVSGGELSIKAERPEECEEKVVYHRRERPRGAFRRVLRLPADVDSTKVEANLADGVLTLTLPKAENAKPRKINVTPG